MRGDGKGGGHINIAERGRKNGHCQKHVSPIRGWEGSHPISNYAGLGFDMREGKQRFRTLFGGISSTTSWARGLRYNPREFYFIKTRGWRSPPTPLVALFMGLGDPDCLFRVA
jgi:hypothetical protein